MRPSHAPTALFQTLVILLAIAGLASASALEPGQPTAISDEVAPGGVLFQLRAEAFSSAEFSLQAGTTGRTGLSAVDEQLASIGVYEVVQAFDLDRNRAAKSAAGLDRVFFARFDGDLDPRTAAARLTPLPEIEYAEPNGIWRAFFAPNDPLYPSQWAHDNTGQAVSYGGDLVGTPDCDTDTDQAWDLQTGDPNLVLAIIDTGCDLNHPEYSSRIVQGYDFVNNDWNPSDDGNHGTACAGIAVAAGDNSQGIAGVAWQIKLMPVKVLDSDGGGTWEGVADGIVFAADNGARVLSLSLGGGSSSTVENAVNYAFGEGCALFCATGNGNQSQLSYPARYANTIAVGAMSPCCERKSPNSCDEEYWWGSNYGTGIDFLTPGTRIHTTDRLGSAGYSSGDYFDEFNGTSSATPHAAGIGALVWSQDPSLTNAELRTVLRNTCDDLGASGYDNQTGYGRLNAHQAVLAVTTQEQGACCYADGTCQYVEEADCPTGDWRIGVTCNPNPCPQPLGACCFADGTCQYVEEADCPTGDWRIGVTCNPNPCPQPLGACCFADGTCQYVEEADCPTGDWRVNLTCDPNPCTQPAVACCFPDGSCTFVTAEACTQAGGSPQGYPSDCDPNPCTQPSVACCFPDGSCTFVTAEACTQAGGSPQGYPSDCDPNPCPQPLGACCYLDGTCEYVEEAQCPTGDWRVGEPCDPNPCISSDAEDEASLPAEWALTRSVPNPFRHSTTIRYALPEPSSVTIRIFDISGNVVRTLLHKAHKGAGYHDTSWDGTDDASHAVGSGVYFYCFETAWGHETETVILIR